MLVKGSAFWWVLVGYTVIVTAAHKFLSLTEYYKHDSIDTISLATTTGALIVLSYLVAKSQSKVVHYSVLTVLFFSTLIQYSAYHAISAGVDATYLSLALDNTGELLSVIELYLTLSSVVIAILFTAVFFGLIFITEKMYTLRFSVMQISVFIALLFGITITTGKMNIQYASADPMLSLGFSSTEYIVNEVRKAKNRLPSRELAPAPANPNKHSSKINIVYILGESITSKHLKAYGYNRDTTPHLNTLISRYPSVVFNNVVSQGDCTNRTLPQLMIQPEFPARNSIAERPTLFSYAKSAGYATAYLAARKDPFQGRFIDESIDVVVRGNEHMSTPVGGSINDFDMLPALRKLASAQTSQFVAIQPYSAHWPYAEQYNYDEKYAVFKPSHQESDTMSFNHEDLERIVNSYDNAILYFDEFFYHVFNAFRGHPTVFVITSDHGQSLGEDDMWGQCSGRVEQFSVPLIFLANSELASDRASIDLLKTIVEEPISQGNIFLTILKIFGYEDSDLGYRYAPSLYDIDGEGISVRKVLLSPIEPPDRVDRFALINRMGEIIGIEKRAH